MPGMSSPTGAYSRRRRPRRRTRLLDGLAHAVQHLHLEGVVGQAQLAGRHQGRGQGAHVVGAEGRTQVVAVLQHGARQAFEHGVGVALVREHGHGPALLGRQHRLVVPVGALDEAQVHGAAALAGPGQEPLQVGVGVAQIGLQHHARLVVAAELVLVEQRGEHGHGEVPVAVLLLV